MKAMRIFLKAHGFRMGELDPEDSIRAMKRLEYVPAKEEVYKTSSVYGLKWRTVTLRLFQSRLRNSALKALRYGVLKD